MIDALDDGVLCDGDIAVSDISSYSDACDGVIVCVSMLNSCALPFISDSRCWSQIRLVSVLFEVVFPGEVERDDGKSWEGVVCIRRVLEVYDRVSELLVA